MNKNKEKLIKYANTYTEFKETRKVGIERMKAVLLCLSKITPGNDMPVIAG